MQLAVYAPYAEAFSDSTLRSHAAIVALPLIVKTVRFVLSATAFVLLCLANVSPKIIPLCFCSIASSSLWNSPTQSTCICMTWCVVAFSRALIILMSASVVSFLVRNGLVTTQRL